jgi:hypothetical protein
MSAYQRWSAAALLAAAFCGGVVAGQTERLELLGNLKFFGAGNGIIFSDGTKQTSAGVGSSTDLVCTGCVNDGEIAANAIGSGQIAADSLTAEDLANDSVAASELAADAVGASEIAAGAVGASEMANAAVGLGKLNLVILTDLEFNYPGNVLTGNCSEYLEMVAPGAPANAFVMIYGVRSRDWLIQGERTPTATAGLIKVRSCNRGSASSEAPNVKFDAWIVAQ